MSNTHSEVRSDTGRALAAALAWTAYIVAPADGWGWMDGVPLGWTEAAALVLLWWTWASARRLPATRLLVILTVAKLTIGGIFVDRGLAARYYANDSWTSPAERSIEFPGEAFTRRDERLAFGVADRPDLPLYFFNDLRFNFYRPEEPQRNRLAYSVEWEGFLHAADATERVFYLDAGSGVSSSLSIDDRTLLTRDAGSRRSAPVRLENGWHALTVTVKAPYGASRRIEAGEIVDGVPRPFGHDRVYLQPAGSIRLAVDTALRWVTRLIDVAVVASLAWLALSFLISSTPVRKIAALLWLGGLVEALMLAYPYAHRLVLIGGGDDWLAYESYARAIALGDFIRVGQDGPFYYQAFYPYFLAAIHVVFGEEMFALVFVQRVLLVATIGWTAMTTRHLFGTRAGWIAALAGGAFLYAKAGRWTTVALSEAFFIPLLAGWLALLSKAALEQPSRSRVAAASIVGGIATLTRSTLLLAWLPMLLLWRASLRGRSGRVVVALALAMTAIFALLPLRNWIVAGRFTFAPTSFAVNVHLGNTPSRTLDPAPPERQAIYDRLQLEQQVRTVAEFAIQAPNDFARGLANKALYTIGFFGRSGLPGGIGTSWLYVGMWLLALLGAVRVLRAPTPLSPAVWLPGAAALSHTAAVILIFPHGYTDRLILPLYPPLIPYAAYAAEPLLHVIPRAVARLGVVLSAAGASARGWARGHIMRRVHTVLRRRGNWLYLAYTAAAVLSPEPASALMLPAAALAVSRLTVREWAHQTIGGGLWALALVRVAMAGSLSASALNDPLFWGLLALIALGISAVAGRWPTGAFAATALAGAFTTVATLLPVLPDLESSFPRADMTTMSESMTALVRQFGPVTTLCLVGLWIQAILTGGTRATTGRVAGAARAALAVSLVLLLAGAVPGTAIDVRIWLPVLGALVGLVEAKAPPAQPTRDAS